MANSPMLELIARGEWLDQQPWFDRLAAWQYYPMLLETLEQLNHDALFVSTMHGLGHIERTILQGAFCAMEEPLDEADTRLLLLACSYHDVGRINDWVDHLHGHRSAGKIGELTGHQGEDLLILQGAVDAHSQKEAAMDETLAAYGARDSVRAKRIAQLLKDADGLDRVRLGDLNPAYLRREASKQRVALAQRVFDRYQAAIGMPRGPILGEEIAAKMRQMDKMNRKS